MKLAVLGASGRMGRLVCELATSAPDVELVASISRTGTPVGPGCFADADVVIDFSLPQGLSAALPHLGNCALVTGTTGLSPNVQKALDAQSQRAAVLQAANFSLGVNLLLDLVARAAAALPDADLEIVEAHHRHKRDAPSGTALALGRAAAASRGVSLDEVAQNGRAGETGERSAAEIGFHAVRGGSIVGDHSVLLLTGGERVEIAHSALSRSVFAEGALSAARWLSGRPAGIYSMNQVLFGV